MCPRPSSFSSTLLLDLIQVLEQLFYFIRHSGATITEKTFNKVVQCGSVRGEPVKRFLRDLTWLHAPAVVLSTFWDKSKKDQHHHHLNDLLTFLSGVSVSEENSGEPDSSICCLQDFVYTNLVMSNISLSSNAVFKKMKCIRRMEGQL